MICPMSRIGVLAVLLSIAVALPSLAWAQSPPVIDHTPIAGPLQQGVDVEITATVTDPDPADSVLVVEVNFQRGAEPPRFFPLNPQGGGLYAGIIPGVEVLAPGFDYRIEARDPSDSLSIFPPPEQPGIWVEVTGGAGSPPVITHTPPAGPLPANQAFILTAVVTDPDGNETIDRVLVEVYKDGPPLEFFMAPTGQPNEYGVQIPAGEVQPPGIEYRVVAEDTTGNAVGHPGFGEGSGHWIAVSSGGGSGSPPELVHTLVIGPVPANQPVEISAIVTDPDGNETLDEVFVEVSRGGPPLEFWLSPSGQPNEYVGQIPASEILAPGFSYRLVAADTTGLEAAVPGFQSDPHWVDVSAGGAGGSAPQISHTPIPSPQPPGSAITVTATVTDVDGDLDAVGFEIYKEGMPPVYYPMTNTTGDTYEGTVPSADVTSPGLGYRIQAEDVNHNAAASPGFAFDPYWVTVGSGTGSPPVITHTPISGPVPKNVPVEVVAIITDPDGNGTIAFADIEISRGGPPMVFAMAPTGAGDEWSGTIPGNEILDPGFTYRIIVEDVDGNVSAKPDFQYDPHWVSVTSGSGGGSPPAITHTPLSGPVPPGEAIEVSAAVTDPDGDLDHVEIEFERPGAPPAHYPMSLFSGNEYRGTIPAGEVMSPGFEYRIVAEDSLMNVTANPAFNYDPYWVSVGSGGGTGSPPSITHTPVAGPVPAGALVTITARVTDPDGDAIEFAEVEFSNGGPPMIFGMAPDVDPGWYTVDIPAGEIFPPGFEYRIVAGDTTGNDGATPGFQDMPYWVNVSTGSGGGTAPAIVHTPLTSPQPEMTEIEVTATVTDVDGDLTDVGIDFERPGAPPSFFPMVLDSGDLYRGTIPAGEIVTPGFNYRVVAKDANYNDAGNPAFNYAPYWIDVSSGGTGEGNPPTITHSPIPSPQSQGMNIQVSARVTDPDSTDFISDVHLEVSRGGPPMHFPMWLDPATGDYIGDIPGNEVMVPGFDYRIVASDGQGHVKSNPEFQYPPYWVEVGGGTGGGSKPVITFAPLPSPQTEWQDITVTATVTDPDG
ncbi:MAG: hypothetical protein KAW17_10720, partial [Candidatus Eisenbacteria sp.]|nr:hypothetical protein [Candidatus Eisenbacteria bacterium]